MTHAEDTADDINMWWRARYEKLEAERDEWRQNSSSFASACAAWQTWARDILTERKMQPDGGECGDDVARGTLAELMRSP